MTQTIKNAVIEATRVYCQLSDMGFPMGYIDVGGGLGIDYDGSRSNFESSTNYTMEEYARDIVFNVREICRSAGVAEYLVKPVTADRLRAALTAPGTRPSSSR